MPRPPHALLLAALGAGLTLGCTIDSRPSGSAPGPNAAAPKPAETRNAEAPVAVPCVLDVTEPGPLRRAGHAKVKLTGQGLAVDTDVPALCGPLFNRDVDALGVKAGEGLLFETCVPQGYVQLTSRQRALGVQRLHHGDDQAGSVDLSFNLVGGATYSSRGLPTDRVMLSDDFWKAEAELVLRDVAESGELQARISFDCSAAPTPAAGATDAP